MRLDSIDQNEKSGEVGIDNLLDFLLTSNIMLRKVAEKEAFDIN